MRLVHQKPQYDGYYNNSTFLPDEWVAASAPRIYVGALHGAGHHHGVLGGQHRRARSAHGRDRDRQNAVAAHRHARSQFR